MPKLGLIEFIIFVIPGFIAVEFYRSFYPARQKNTFSQIGMSISLGLIIVIAVHSLGYSILSVVDKSRIVITVDAKSILVLLVSGAAFGILLTFLHFIRFRLSKWCDLFSWLSPDPQQVWASINGVEDDDWAVVYLKDGSQYLGYIAEYVFDPNKDDHDFLLSEAKRVNEKLEERYSITGKGVYINTRDVTRIEFLKGD